MEWVSVKESMPKLGSLCLVTDTNNNIEVAEFDTRYEIDSDDFDGTYCWFLQNWDRDAKFNVTHWIYIPLKNR